MRDTIKGIFYWIYLIKTILVAILSVYWLVLYFRYIVNIPEYFTKHSDFRLFQKKHLRIYDLVLNSL